MANNEEKPTDAQVSKAVSAAVGAQSFTVEELAARLGTPAWALAGVRVREGWAVGQVLKQAEYEAALNTWLSGPTALEVSDG